MTNPDVACDPLEVALAEYMLRLDLGEPVDRERFAAEHPAAADALRAYFRECDELNDLTGADEPPPELPPFASDDLPPAFDGYEILDVVGRGGMGVVYKARHAQLNRTVALKTVQAGTLDPADAGRFLREAEATARLDHPHIVPVYDFGYLPGGEEAGRAYFAMKWVGGGSLRDRRGWYVARPAEAARLMATVARAVHHAHQRGILHRDLKPANILLDDAGEPVVSDFGLAVWVDQGRGGDRAGLVYGTPGYMAPEQAAADGPEPTTAVDVYGLGAVLYDLLTGRPPYPSDTPTGALVQMALGRPPHPRALNPAVSRDLGAVCRKCLNPDPRARYSSAAELADDLERVVAGEPVHARPHTTAERVVKWARRRPTLAALCAVTLLVTVAGVAGVVTLWRQADRDRQKAENSLAAEKTAEAARAATQAAQTVALADHDWRDGWIDRADRDLGDCPDEFRCWEWHHLKRLCRPPFGIAAMCPRPVSGVAFSPDGRWLAAASEDGAIRVQDVGRGGLARVLGVHKAGITRVAFGRLAPPSGGAAISCVASCAGGTVRFWNPESGAVLRAFAPASGPAADVAFGADGWRVASLGEDGVVRVWDAATGEETAAVAPREDRDQVGITRVALGSDPEAGPGRPTLLAVATADGEVGVYEAATGKPVHTLTGHVGAVHALAFAPNGRWLASACADQTVRVWDLATGRPGVVLVGHRRDVYGVAFDPTGGRVVTAGHDRSVRVWDRATGREELAFRGHTNHPRVVAFHPDGHRLASGGQEGRVAVWDTRQQQGQRVFAGNPEDAYALALSAGGSRLATGCRADGLIRVWDARGASGSTPALGFGRPGVGLNVIGFDAPGRRVVSGWKDGKLVVWDAATGRELLTVKAHAVPVREVVFSPDGTRLASAGHDGGVKVWAADTGRELLSLPGHRGPTWCVAFSPDGRLLATGGTDHLVRLWDATTGAEVHTFGGHASVVHWVAWSPDGRLLATAAADRSARVWDVDGRRPVVAVLTPGSDTVNGVAFSPDGRRLAVGCSDRTVKLLDPLTGREALVLHGHTDPVMAVAFTADGTGLASAGKFGDLRIWEAEPPR